MDNGKQKEILLICTAVQDSRDLAFLMKLSGYGYRLASDVMEGVNYLNNCRINDLPLHLIVADGATMVAGDQREMTLLQEVRQQTPLLIVDRSGGGRRCELLGCLRTPTPEIFFCMPEEVVETVEQIFRQGSPDEEEKSKNPKT